MLDRDLFHKKIDEADSELDVLICIDNDEILTEAEFGILLNEWVDKVKKLIKEI
jgi:hypothetical protein